MYTQEQQEFFKWLSEGDNAEKFDRFSKNQQPATSVQPAPDAGRSTRLGAEEPGLVVGGSMPPPETQPGMLTSTEYTPEQLEFFDWLGQGDNAAKFERHQAAQQPQGGGLQQIAQMSPEEQEALRGFHEAGMTQEDFVKLAELGQGRDFVQSFLGQEDPDYSLLDPQDQERLWRNYNNELLSEEERASAWSYNPVQQATNQYQTLAQSSEWNQLNNKQKMETINATWNQWHQMAIKDPEAFAQWERANPKDAIRYHARAANKNVKQGDGLTNKEHKERAQMLAYQEALDQGFGKDAKKDGKMIAYDYETFDDVTNEWGPGDWFKIGNASTLPSGISGMWENIKSDPGKYLAPIAASVAIGFLAGPLATALNISEAAATAVLTGAKGFAEGDSVDDVLKEVAMTYGLDVGLDKLTPYLKDIDYIEGGQLGDLGLGTIDVKEQKKLIRGIVEAGGDAETALAQMFGNELGQGFFGADGVYNTLADRNWTPEAFADATGKMLAEGVDGGDIADILLSGAKEYEKADGSIGTIPVPDFSLGEIPGSGVVGDLLEYGEQALDEVYEFIRDDLPDIQPEWIRDPEGVSESAPQWLKDLIDDAGQYGDEVYEFIRDDLPDIQPDNWEGSESIDIDLPNWEGSESIDFPEIPTPKVPDIPTPNAPDIPTPKVPDIPTFNVPDITTPISDGMFSGAGASEAELLDLYTISQIERLPPMQRLYALQQMQQRIRERSA